MPDRTHQVLALNDGRQLGYAEYGDPAGMPLFYFHGFPGSRLEAAHLDRPARAAGFRVIAVDRPGTGLSDFQAGRRMGRMPEDIRDLANALGIGRFFVLGYSGGGPYALVCARRLPGRVIAAASVSGLGPADEPDALDGMGKANLWLFEAAQRAPTIAGFGMRWMGFGMRFTPDKVYDRLIEVAPATDRAILERPEIRTVMLDELREAFDRGSRGMRHELWLLSRPWGFSLDRIRVPVFVWQGLEDAVVPAAMGRHLARTIPGCTATFLPSAGHFWIFTHAPEVLAQLASVVSRDAAAAS
jgi:pimeloyl-ACP methyl ester carboxylesterase